MYRIPCGCGRYEYIGETGRKWETRRKEHESKVRLTEKDIAENKIESAEKRMNTGDGGLARHSQTCSHTIQWDKSRVIRQETHSEKRKFLESLESVRAQNSNKKIY